MMMALLTISTKPPENESVGLGAANGDGVLHAFARSVVNSLLTFTTHFHYSL